MDWIHRGMLMEGMSTILVAREGVGKSLFAVNLANAVANGGVFLGQKHKPRPVLYLDMENPLAVAAKRTKEFSIRTGGNLKYVGLFTNSGGGAQPWCQGERRRSRPELGQSAVDGPAHRPRLASAVHAW